MPFITNQVVYFHRVHQHVNFDQVCFAHVEIQWHALSHEEPWQDYRIHFRELIIACHLAYPQMIDIYNEEVIQISETKERLFGTSILEFI